MHALPTPILGEITALTINTPDLNASFEYYKKLGFSEVFRADWPFPWIQVTDGALLIMFRKENTPYLALTYYVKDINKVVADLDAKGIEFTYRAKPTDPVIRYVFKSPDGLVVSLVSIIEGFQQPAGPTMLKMAPTDYFNPEKYANKTCGMFGELAHPVANLEQSLEFWKLLGFTFVSKFGAPYPWAIISDGISIVGLHQTDKFTGPAITYFAADMKNKIAALKADGLTSFIEQADGNLVLTTPEGQHINLFRMGM